MKRTAWPDHNLNAPIDAWQFDADERPNRAESSDALIAAGESGILSASMIFRLVDPASALHRIREVIGDFAALSLWRLARDHAAQTRATSTRPSRCQLYIPKDAKTKTAARIRGAIGPENTEQLIDEFFGAILDLPNGSEVRREQAMVCALTWHKEGLSAGEIAEALKGDYPVSEDWVRRVVRSASAVKIKQPPR